MKLAKYIKFLPILISIVLGSYFRIQYMDLKPGGDDHIYWRSAAGFIEGVNPYEETVRSFANEENDPTNRGYAYLPGYLYLFVFFVLFSIKFAVPIKVFVLAMIVIADIVIVYIMIKEIAKRSYLAAAAGLAVWLLNPIIMVRHSYAYRENLAIMFVLMALYYLQKDEVKSGAFYALSIVFRTFPYILFPVFFLLTKDKKRFLLSAFIVGLAFSLPFITSFEALQNYIQGSVLVHSDRFVQGRPLLFYISYYYKIEFFQILPFSFYTYMASFFAWPFIFVLWKKKWVTNKYALGALIFLNFYIFTPVLNRTYMLWGLPVILIGSHKLLYKKNKFLYYCFIFGYWAFYSWYLAQWKDGFHIWRPSPY